ncbi:MAG: DUF3035 domain-containing protein [Rhodospirillales bacterium]|nr:DUF3035 domain-containing protein [Rhodospirillales bacterium]MDP6804014.1 DUF3035 domain-containing protein [Rhodospirillales bacterium]
MATVHSERNAGSGTAARIAWLALALGVVGVLAGCDDARRLFNAKTPPDEFAVYARPPLSMPPEFTLRPPAPGSPPLQEVNPRAGAQQSLVGAPARQRADQSGRSAFGDASPGLRAILESTGAVDADPDIRAQINRDSFVLAEESETFADALIFWKEPPGYETVVDPAKETRRIRENQALGRAITTGEVPTIARKREALFEGVFD